MRSANKTDPRWGIQVPRYGPREVVLITPGWPACMRLIFPSLLSAPLRRRGWWRRWGRGRRRHRRARLGPPGVVIGQLLSQRQECASIPTATAFAIPAKPSRFTDNGAGHCTLDRDSAVQSSRKSAPTRPSTTPTPARLSPVSSKIVLRAPAEAPGVIGVPVDRRSWRRWNPNGLSLQRSSSRRWRTRWG